MCTDPSRSPKQYRATARASMRASGVRANRSANHPRNARDSSFGLAGRASLRSLSLSLASFAYFESARHGFAESPRSHAGMLDKRCRKRFENEMLNFPSTFSLRKRFPASFAASLENRADERAVGPAIRKARAKRGRIPRCGRAYVSRKKLIPRLENTLTRRAVSRNR